MPLSFNAVVPSGRICRYSKLGGKLSVAAGAATIAASPPACPAYSADPAFPAV